MTSPVSPSETIAKAMEGVTPPDKLHVVFSTWKEDGSINIRRWSTFMEFDGSTAYIAEPSVNAVTKERDALALQLEAMQREMAEKDERIAALEGALDESQSMHLSALRRNCVSRDVVNSVLTWAEQRCPCHNEQPNPCPLCGASVENLEPCKSAENTIPRHLLADLRRARTLIQGEKK
ncbi:hypothetical protein D0Y60_01830 [Shinella sp. WSJ-2]|uniref:hypothetical protein n=1 Tax=Shinella sp. WSJ-2 TaxID=2303749 RepID=UPI000E3DCADC|nr:hypothetical protein [Shinella sp. WSJ-2]RFZ89394.1 hypothetical protein D0Y60_01830 [Shinella sp. WSJ-2]